jgi:hypothetical protein
MAGQGLPLHVATLLTGLLECLGFAGVLFGWASLVFVFKTEHYFKELCEPNAGLLSNATEQAGKNNDGFSNEVELGSWEVGRGREDSTFCPPVGLSVGEGVLAWSPLSLRSFRKGSTSSWRGEEWVLGAANFNSA